MKSYLFITVALWAVACLASIAQGVDYDTYFEDATLRLDYIMAGDASHSGIYFEEACRQERWAGRKARLDEVPLLGNGQIYVCEQGTGKLLYAHTFSTLYQEWLLEDEAKILPRAFESSYNVPFPKQKVDITIQLLDHHQKEICHLKHTIDPSDILIRRVRDRGIPFQYVWKGGPVTGYEAKGNVRKRNYIPSKYDPFDGVDVTGKVDLAILAEGYTEAEMGKFYIDCQRAAEALFSYEPFTSLKDRFNIVAVAAPSYMSGPTVPHEHIASQTAVSAHYDTFYSQRYLTTQQMHAIYDLLAGVPFEHIMVLVNTDTYGGGGIYNQVTLSTSDHPTFRQVFVHEFGHSYGGLADEYAYDDMDQIWYPLDVEPWEPNITTQKDFARKWKGMPGTGLYEGAGYQTKNCWRPVPDCRMRTNESPDFCPVCTKAIKDITDFYTAK